MKRLATLPRAAIAVVAMGSSFVGCPCVNSAVNDSPWLKWRLFAAFGADRVCAEMSKRSAPLALGEGSAAIGRFFPSACQSTIDDARRTITVRFAGDGYAWTPLTGMASFSGSATVEYATDLRLDGDALWVWFKPTSAPSPAFQIGRIERSPDLVTNLFSPLTAQLASALVGSELGRGFTVVHDDDGDDFALGILQPPARPDHPWAARGSDRATLAAGATDVHARGMELIGPLEIDRDGRTLFVRVRPSGLAVDLAVVRRDLGEVWRRQYQADLAVRPPPGPVLASSVAPAEVDAERALPLPRGQYYVVIDNSDAFGQVAPPPVVPLVGDAPARITYRVSIGDTP